MTVFEAYSKLWTYFKEHDSFVMDENFKDIVLVSEQPTRDRACMQSALDDWVKTELLVVQKGYACWESTTQEDLGSNEKKEKDVYTLKKSLDSNEQSIAIHPNLAGFLMNEINEFCELIEDKTDWCDPTSLGSKDVMNLLHILNFYKTKYREASGIDEEKNG
jgi:hypothetical protein